MKLTGNHFSNVDTATNRVIRHLGCYHNDSDFNKKFRELAKDEAALHDLHADLKYLQSVVLSLTTAELV
jgi:hypothetical protein